MTAISARQVATGVGLAAATIAGIRGFQDATDGTPDSANGYLGYGLLAAVGASYLGPALGGSLGRGVAGASVFTSVLAGGALGALMGAALNND